VLSVKNISFSYNEVLVIDAISFDVKEGEVLALLGESGSGKSTLLKLIYGVLDVDFGLISWKNQEILGPKNKLIAGLEFMKYVTQEFDLMPFTSVAENIGVHLSSFYPLEKKQRTDELLGVVGLSRFAAVNVQFLSGGQKQRVALAKALARAPEVILLDEPFSHIDSFKKRPLRRRIFKYLKSKKIACVVATHDKNDVLSFADNILVIQDGRALASAPPEVLFKNPQHPSVAAFFSEHSCVDGDIYYAHQIKLASKGPVKARVVKSYFKGGKFLVEAAYKGELLFFEHDISIAPGSLVFLSLDKSA
jgi:ABC-type Fe3+/spermidine/putrescine transport system ATPase subunit